MNRLPELLSVSRIWDAAPHNAMTDLLWYQDKWFCTFRESDSHMSGEDGRIRVISSSDAKTWASYWLWDEPLVDLRDPKLCILPDGRLMLLAGGSHRNSEGRYVAHDTRVTFSNDAVHWDKPRQILNPGEWLWRLTWFKGVGYGVSYSYEDPLNRSLPWHLKLFKTRDGISYDLVTSFALSGFPSETTLCFTPSGEMLGIVRRESLEDDHAWLGRSKAPFKDWIFKSIGCHIGGPNIIQGPKGSLWVAGRMISGEDDRTALCRLVKDVCEPVLWLPSEGDSSYPGLVLRDTILWMSYYSSHEDKTAIYLAQIRLPS